MMSDDRPALETEEVEITPEMIEAGVRAFGDCDTRFFTPEDTVVTILLAALAQVKA